MRGLRTFVLLPALAVLVSSASSSPAADDRPRDVSAALATIRAKHDVPGLVALTLVGDRVVAQGAAGVRRRGGEDRVTIDDRMHLGSCTKAMTATLCALLVQEKKLRWDDRPAATFAKEPGDAQAFAIDPGWKDATLEMLLKNHGGAPTSLDAGGLWLRLCADRLPPRATRITLVRGVLGRPPVAPPGTKFEYSNAGFSIAGAMTENALDASWEDIARKRLFEPLGMTTAGFGAPVAPLVPPAAPGSTDAPAPHPKVSVPRGHRADGTPVDPGPGDDNPDAIAPAGKVHASLPDWAKFVSLHLRAGKGTDGPLGTIDFARLHAPFGGKPPGDDYAMGWSVTERPWAKGPAEGDRGRVLTHAGSNLMWYCVAWLAPERGFAVLAATNQGGDPAARACDDAASALIREHLGPR